MQGDAMEQEEMSGGEEMEAESADAGTGKGYSIVMNCYEGSDRHDVFTHPLIRASEEDHPDGFFGLATFEEGMRAIVAAKKQGMGYESPGHEAMMGSYNE